MKRSDFVERGERKIDFLANWAIVRRWVLHKYNIKSQDLELLLYLDPLRYFTSEDFRTGTLMCSWEQRKMKRLQEEGWIKRVTNESKNGHYKYVTTPQCKRMIQHVYRVLLRVEDIPEHPKRNPIMKEKTYKDKLHAKAIRAANKRNRNET